MSSGTVCDNCIHVSECMEQRGQCTDYRNYQDIIRQTAEEIARLNEECKDGHTGRPGTRNSGSDKEGIR